jgi:glycosyltransferase involved in cell wall biosynthesis
MVSALNQTFTQIKIKVYDDASNDGTEEVVRESIQKDDRIEYYRHQQNIGLLRNYQHGLSEVKTEYFSFLSDDDLLLPWFYEEALKGFQNFPDCAFSAGSAIIMTEEAKVVRVPLDLWEGEGIFNPPAGLLEMISKYPIPSCILFHRKVIETLSIDMDNPLTWDCDYLLQCAARYCFYISKRPCGIFLHHCSYSNSKDFEEWNFSLKRMIERINLNPFLTIEIKEKAAILINKDLEKLNKPIILKYIYQRKLDEAYGLAITFRRDYGLKLETFILLNLTRFCLWFPLFVHIVLWFRKLKKIKQQRSFLQYKNYAKWLTK